MRTVISGKCEVCGQYDNMFADWMRCRFHHEGGNPNPPQTEYHVIIKRSDGTEYTTGVYMTYNKADEVRSLYPLGNARIQKIVA